MSRKQSIPSGIFDSSGNRQQISSPLRGGSFSNSASFSPDTGPYDTALPPINFQTPNYQTSIAHRRTGSTLKTVMRKIFTRRRQSQAEGLEESPEEAHYAALPARKSAKPAEGKSFLAIPTRSESKQSSPLSEENLHLADSHLSPTAMSHGSLDSPGLAPPRRRATLPSVVFSDDDESRYAVASTAAASDPQEDRPHMPDEERRRSLLHSRRRSRSANALRGLKHDLETAPVWETQSSQLPDSKSPPFGGSSFGGQSARPSTPTTVTSITRASAAPSLPGSDHHAEQLGIPPNVGNLVHNMQQGDGLTLEQRLTTMEVKLIDLEFAIARMQSHSIDPEQSSRQKQAAPMDSCPPYLRRKASGYSGSGDNDDSPSPLASLLPGRPTSTATVRPETTPTTHSRTIRPAHSATSLSDLNGVSIEQYSALVTLLRREQTARRNLEGQVTSLRDDIRQLQRTALHSMELGTMYPIRSVESQELLRFRRALDGSDESSPIRTDEKLNGNFETDSDIWGDPDSNSREDPFGPSKWDRQRSVTTTPITSMI